MSVSYSSPIPRINLPAVVAALGQFLHALTVFPNQKPTTALSDARDRLRELLVPTEANRGDRQGCEADIAGSDLSLGVKAALIELLDTLSPSGMHRLMERREKAILRLRGLVEKLASSGEETMPWDDERQWAKPPRGLTAPILQVMLPRPNGVAVDDLLERVWGSASTKAANLGTALSRTVNKYLQAQGHPKRLSVEGAMVVWA